MDKPKEIHPDDERRAWLNFPGSDFQKVLHNEFLKRIEEGQRKLENVMPQELLDAQGVVKTYRAILALIHSKDPTHIREFYARE